MTNPDDPQALFSVDGDLLVPTLLSQGPWDPTTLHGGPVSAILARQIERGIPAGVDQPPMRVGRLTVDMFKPVPMAPLLVTHDVVRAGRQIHVIDSHIRHDGKLVARATGVIVRADKGIAVDAAMNALAAGDPPPGKDARNDAPGIMPDGFGDFVPPGFVNAIELRRVVGDQGLGTPAVAWTRLIKPLVEGEAVTPLQRLACLGDFASGMANYLDFTKHLSPNADLSFHISRYPDGEWLGLDCRCVHDPGGIGQSSARLFDEERFVGHANATIVVSKR